MFPEEFIKRISTQKYADTPALLKALSEPSPNSIRINTSKWNKRPAHSEIVPWCNDGYYLESRPSYTLDPLFHSGCYYPQEASGMFLGSVVNQVKSTNENLRVLDLCAAPGGKSTHLAGLIGKNSLLISNDAIRSRASILAETLTKWGSGNVLVTQNDPAAFGKLPGYFDIIVVDAPCSGEGMFRTGIAVSEWSVANTIHCVARQKRILMDVWPALKGNGILVYSTCTFNPGENEENIKWLTGRKDAVSLELDISGLIGISQIDFEGTRGYGFYPDKIKGEGFFISALRKTENQEEIRVRSQKRADLKPLKSDLSIAGKWTSFPMDFLFKLKEDLYSAPCNMEEFLFLFSNLRIVKAGTKIMTNKNNSFLPSHEIALSTSLKTDAFPVNEMNLADVLAFMRRDSLSLKNGDKGWNILKYNGVNIGFVNNLGNRLNNYFPLDWRIRMDLPERGKENIINWE